MSFEARIPVGSLNEYQRRRLLVTCEHIDKMLSQIEDVLNQSSSKSVFPKYASEIPLKQKRTIEAYIGRIRAQLLRILDGQQIAKHRPSISPTHSIRVALTFVAIDAEELAPKRMQGYGSVPEAAATDLHGIVGELLRLTSQVDQYVSQDPGNELTHRIQQLEATTSELALLRNIERIIAKRGLVEFRAALESILDRAEDKSFEIAVFGRVSSGKSSLLNSILRTDVLPVGVTPITAVLTRITYGDKPSMDVWFADRPLQTLEPQQLREFATEQRNPGNEKRVSRIVVHLPVPRLREGVTFVDTPGLGSLATTGASETLAYLPKCDLGVVLIDAASTLTPDDLHILQALSEATIPVHVLLSKADLLSDQDCERVVDYIKQHVLIQCGLDLRVRAVSALEDHRVVLDQWFQSDIHPLYARCQDLRAISLKRKIGSLRNSVAHSLRMQVRRARSTALLSPAQVRETEGQLRVATGKIEALLTKVEEQTEKWSDETRRPLAKAAADLSTFWGAKTKPETSPEVVARNAIVMSVQEEVQVWQREINLLTRDLCEALHSSAESLDIPDKPRLDEFQSLVRELPVFDLPELHLSITRPLGSSLLGKELSQSSLLGQLERQVGPRLTEALETYARLFRRWAAETLGALREYFNTYADNYRARAEGVQSQEALSQDDETQIRADLRLLEAEERDNARLLPIGEKETNSSSRQ
jgi:GTP-binding protein EngB required for normal cell division